jgi:hypothetical protein
LSIEFVRPERLLIERWATAARTVERTVDARLAKLRADNVFLEMIETHLLACNLDPLAGEKGEE